MIVEKQIKTNDLLTESKLPDADFVINPYVGCPHKCIYCYAEFMKRFTNHHEEWGTFIDVKMCDKPINIKKIKNKEVFISSTTDAYNMFEKKYEVTRNILKQLVNSDANVEILTKSDLVLRDIDLLKQIKNINVGISLNTLDDSFRKDIEPFAPSVDRRINALKELKQNGIETFLFMSPIFPQITDFISIIEATKDYVDRFCFENLNLRGSYLHTVLEYIKNNRSELIELYEDIYINKNMEYFINLEKDIEIYCEVNKINYKSYFWHEKIKKK